jgi:hypothetical protein
MAKTKSEYKKAKTELDEVFSKFIRHRDANKDGNIKCCTCPKILPIAKMQCGHFVNRDKLATRWSEINCASQCWGCNSKALGNGRKDEHSLYIINKYGLEALHQVLLEGKKITKLSTADLQDMAAKYKELLKQF